MRFRIEHTDMWGYLNQYPICVTTNGHVKKDGRATMGKGSAAQALERFPDIDIVLGTLLAAQGNHVTELVNQKPVRVIAFPTKPASLEVPSAAHATHLVCTHMQTRFKYPATIPGWAARANLGLIKQSLDELVVLADQQGWDTVVMPEPGTGNGELDPAPVHNLITEIAAPLTLILCRLP